MASGNSYRCNSCDHKWDRSPLVVTVCPSRLGQYQTWQCHRCQFSIKIPSQTTGNVFRNWKQSNIEMLTNCNSINKISQTIESRLLGKMVTQTEIQIEAANCHFCDCQMTTDNHESAQCPDCNSFLTEICGRLAITVQYVDLADHKRWWNKKTP